MAAKTVLALRHLAFEDLGLLAPWFTQRGWSVHYHDVGVDDLAAIDLAQVGVLVALGGPIGAEDDAQYPFLAQEVQLLQSRLASGEPLLGICLGAQLMARALGARVRPMGVKEIGYAPLSLSAEGLRSPLAAVGDQPVLHWHGDRFELPAGTVSLAATPACDHQAFMVGRQAMAWQFHLEADAARIEQWLVGHALELALARVPTDGLRQAARRHAQGLERAMSAVMERWVAPV